MKKFFSGFFSFCFYLFMWALLIAIAGPIFKVIIGAIEDDKSLSPTIIADLDAVAELLSIFVPTVIVFLWNRTSKAKKLAKVQKEIPTSF